MTLIGNYSPLTKDPGRSLGGNSATTVALGGAGGLGGLVQYRSGWNKPSPARALYAGYAGFSPKNSQPSGYLPGYGATIIQISGGGMASRKRAAGTGGVGFGNLAGVKYAVADTLAGSGTISDGGLRALASLIADLSGSGDLSGTLGGLVPAVATLTGSGTLAGDVLALVQIEAGLAGAGALDADLAAVKFAFADLSGSGGVSAADLMPIASIAADLSGSGTFTADIVGVKRMLADLSGAGVISADTLAVAEVMAALAGLGAAAGDARATGYISGDITPFTDLSPQGLAKAVWDKPLVEHEDETTFGGLMQRLLTVARYLGLR